MASGEGLREVGQLGIAILGANVGQNHRAVAGTTAFYQPEINSLPAIKSFEVRRVEVSSDAE
jgi:hypothetical protein